MSPVQSSVKSPHGTQNENRINLFSANPDGLPCPVPQTPATTSRTLKPRWFKPQVPRSHSPISEGWNAMKKKEAAKKEREIRRQEIRDSRKALRTQQILQSRGFEDVSLSQTKVRNGRVAFKKRSSLEGNSKVRSVLKNRDHFQPPATSTPRSSLTRRSATSKPSEIIGKKFKRATGSSAIKS